MNIWDSLIKLVNTLWYKGFVHLLSANIITLIFGFASQLFIAWILSPEDIGRIKIMQTWLGIFTILAGVGFNASVLKLCSEKRPSGESVFLYKVSLGYTMISVLLTYGIIALVASVNLFSPDRVINRYMIIICISLIPMTISAVYMSYLQARQKVRLYSKIQILTKLFSILIIIILTWLYRLQGFIIALVLGYFLTNVFLKITIKKIKNRVKPLPVASPLKLHWNYARYSLGASITDIIGLGIDILLLNYLISDRTLIGHYGFAITMIGVYRILPSTIWTMAAPHFSNNIDDARNWFSGYKKYNRILVLSSLTITAISIFIIPLFLRFFLDGKYEHAGIYFIYLLVGWCIRNLIVIKASVLFGMGKVKLNFYSSFIYLISSVIIIPALIYLLGIKGAAIGVICASFIGYVSVQYFFKKESNKYLKLL